MRGALTDRAAATGRAALDIVDAGGGTGSFAVPLAGLGHHVTVVDPNPDSLAALERRAAEAGVTARVRPVQGEAVDLPDVIGADGADLVICHSVLEYVDHPAVELDAAVSAARPGAAVSVLIANPVAAALHRALAGQFDDAARLLTDPDGTWGERDPMPRRFTRAAITSLLTDAGLTVAAVQGVRVFADLVPGRIIDGDPGAAESLAALEQSAAGHPALSDIATQLHVLAYNR
ncbi:MAG TPA: methyltransferase domain-containing protein [Streptosporangiaceae bacterium]